MKRSQTDQIVEALKAEIAERQAMITLLERVRDTVKGRKKREPKRMAYAKPVDTTKAG